MFTPLWPAGIELCCLMGVIPVFWEWVLWDGFITRVQFLWLFRNDIVASLCPYMGRSLWPISAGFLCAVWSQYLFYCCCSFSTSLPRPQPCVSLSEWVRSTAPLIPGPLNKKCKKYKHSREGSSWTWGSCSAYFEILAIERRWRCSQNVWQLFPSIHWTLSSRERIPVRCHFTAKHSSATVCSSHSRPYVPPGCYPVLRTPQPLLPILYRLKENPKGLGHNGGKWKSTVFSFYLSFLGLIFCFLVVLISAICNSYI